MTKVTLKCRTCMVGRFGESKYSKWYYQLIDHARAHPRTGVTEVHHIVPSSMGGTDYPSNLVALTPREHYMCHLLLVKMTSGKDRVKMVCAFFRFKPRKSRITSRLYERFALHFRQEMSGEGNPFYGRKHTEATRRLISANHGMRGRSCYDVWVDGWGQTEADRRREEMLSRRSTSLSGSGNPMYGKPRTKEQKASHSQAMKGQNHPNWGKEFAWVRRDSEVMQIPHAELQTYLSKGWERGRVLKQTDRVWVTREGHSKLIPKLDAEVYLSDGWVFGRGKLTPSRRA